MPEKALVSTALSWFNEANPSSKMPSKFWNAKLPMVARLVSSESETFLQSLRETPVAELQDVVDSNFGLLGQAEMRALATRAEQVGSIRVRGRAIRAKGRAPWPRSGRNASERWRPERSR